MLFKSRTKPIAGETTDDVARNLKVASRQLDVMLDSAFRSGVQAALSIVKSWYPEVDLDLMQALRDGSEDSVGAVWLRICKVAAELAGDMNLLEFTPYLDDHGSPIPPQSLSDLLYSSSEGTQSRPAHRARSEASHSSLYVDDDEEHGDDEEGEDSSDGHSASADQDPPSTQPEVNTTSAPGGATITSPIALAPGG